MTPITLDRSCTWPCLESTEPAPSTVLRSPGTALHVSHALRGTGSHTRAVRPTTRRRCTLCRCDEHLDMVKVPTRSLQWQHTHRYDLYASPRGSGRAAGLRTLLPRKTFAWFSIPPGRAPGPALIDRHTQTG